MGILSSLLGPSNPFAMWTDQNRNWLSNVGAGLASGDTFSEGLSKAAQMGPAGQQADNAYRVAEEAKAERLRQINETTKYLQSTFPDLAEAVNSGLPLDAAWNEVMKRSAPQEPPQPTDDIREFDFARQNGFNGSFADWMAKKTPQTNVTTNVGGTDKFYDTMDAKLAEQTAAAIDSGMNARSNNIRLGQLETLLQTAPQGAQGAMVQMAGSLGIPVEGLDDVQAAQALINQMVPGQRPPGSGTMSDADLALFKQSLPQIINQPGGNQLILQTMKAINEYTIAQAQIAQAVANREISPAEGRALQAKVPNPLASLSKPTMAPAKPRLRYNPATGDFE